MSLEITGEVIARQPPEAQAVIRLLLAELSLLVLMRLSNPRAQAVIRLLLAELRELRAEVAELKGKLAAAKAELAAAKAKLAAVKKTPRSSSLPPSSERLGRIKTQNWRASHLFDVTIQRVEPPQGKSRLRITWVHNNRLAQWNELADGCYLLRTNLTDVDPATLWKRYIQLTEAEWAFRIAKDELEIRPIWHHKEDRVKAHILVAFLAYVLWKALAGWMRGAGLGDAPRTVIEELAKIKSGDVVLPARPRNGGPERTIRLRCVTEPDDAQRVLLHRLGLTLTLPRRLRRLDQLEQM